VGSDVHWWWPCHTCGDYGTVLGVPVMNKSCFISTERKIGEWWGAFLEESMKLAG